MKAGELDKQITFETRTTTTDDFGGEVEAFIPWPDTTAAKVTFGTGQERRTAAQEHASQSATFKVRLWPQTEAVTARDRIQYDGAAWDIDGRAKTDPGTITFTAVRAA